MTTQLEQLVRQAEATAQRNRLQDDWADAMRHGLTAGNALAEAMLDQQRVEHDAWVAAYMMEQARTPTAHATLERVMVDAKQAIQDACGLSIRDGTGVMVASFDLAGNAVFNTVPAAAMYEANDWQSAEQAKAFDWSRPSDRDGIEEELRREEGKRIVPIGKPVPVDTAKPALPALGVTASGDHRFGLWRTIE